MPNNIPLPSKVFSLYSLLILCVYMAAMLFLFNEKILGICCANSILEFKSIIIKRKINNKYTQKTQKFM